MSVPSVSNRLRALILDNVEQVADASAVTGDARLAGLGMDSVSGLDLLLAMEEEFNVSFPNEMLTNEVFESHGTLEAALQSLGAK